MTGVDLTVDAGDFVGVDAGGFAGVLGEGFCGDGMNSSSEGKEPSMATCLAQLVVSGTRTEQREISEIASATTTRGAP